MLLVTDPIRITPIGGLGEVGRNMTVVEHDGVRIVIDCGIGFPHGDDRGLGVDIFLPDVRIMRGKPVDAVLITHAHDDHVAALAHLIPADVPAAPGLDRGCVSWSCPGALPRT